MTDPKALTLELQLSAQDDPDQVAEVYADRLMDELFDGVERALAGDVDALVAPPAPAKETADNKSDLTLNFSEGGLPAVLLSERPEDELAHLSSLLVNTSPEATTSAPSKKWWCHLTVNRVLLGAAALSLLATLGLWLHQRHQTSMATMPTAATAEIANANADAEFLEYLRRSLDVIAQRLDESATTTSDSGVPDVPVPINSDGIGLPPIGNNSLPPALMPGGIPDGERSVNVIERVYIPYQAAQAQAQTAQAPLPTTPPQLPAVASGSTANTVPVKVHTLVGVLELGDRSAALFEIEGVPQRVYIGERVGSSDWSLVSVANEEAMIRRNGEVRSIYIGQQF